MAEKETTKKTTAKKSTGKSTKVSSKKTTTKKTSEKKVKKPVEKVEEKVVEEKVVEEIKEVKEEPKKKLSTEEKRVIGLFGILVVIILLYILSAVIDANNAKKIVNKVRELKASSESKLIYLMKEECSYCELNKGNNNALKDSYGVDYYEVDVSKIGEEKREEVLSILEIDSNNFGTPTYVVTKDNSVINVLSGVQAFDDLFNELKTVGIIGSEYQLYLNYINYQGFKNILNSATPEVVVLTSTTCTYCIAERPILEEIAKEENVKINWMYLNNSFTSQEEYDEFNNSLEWFTNNSNWGTPTTLVIKNGEVISALSGYRSKADFVSFLKQNNLINK